MVRRGVVTARHGDDPRQRQGAETVSQRGARGFRGIAAAAERRQQAVGQFHIGAVVRPAQAALARETSTAAFDHGPDAEPVRAPVVENDLQLTRGGRRVEDAELTDRHDVRVAIESDDVGSIALGEGPQMQAVGGDLVIDHQR